MAFAELKTAQSAQAQMWRVPRAPSLLWGFWALYRRELRRQTRAVAFSIIPQGLTAALLIAIRNAKPTATGAGSPLIHDTATVRKVSKPNQTNTAQYVLYAGPW